MEDFRGKISTITAMRADLAQLAIVAVLLSVGANILASGIVILVPPSVAWAVGIGGLIIAVAFILIWIRLRPRINGDTVFNAAIFTDSGSREPISVQRYDFAEDIAMFVKAMASENKALGRAWSENPFFKFNMAGPGNATIERTIAADLAVEATEYHVLRSLSIHLTDYFNLSSDADKDELLELGRNDIPAVLLQNRFIDLFSRPMEEREAFSLGNRPDGAKVISAYGKGGVIYDRFDLTLPKMAQVTRKGHGSIQIRTKRFSLEIGCKLGHGDLSVPFEFYDFYLGRSWSETDLKQASVTLSVKFRPWYLLSYSGWQYYQWLDSFLEKLRSTTDFPQFLRDIAWEAASTIEIVRTRDSSQSTRSRGSSSPRGKRGAERVVHKNTSAGEPNMRPTRRRPLPPKA